ncbi:MAG: hypothetical protein ICV84_23580 [Flavisolibacter sp.]|nr:hypothetical protein [Flavisolibacter sp.]
MGKQSFTLLIFLLIGCFTFSAFTFIYIYKTTVTNSSITQESRQPVENMKNGEMIWETVSRQCLIAIIAK